MEHHRDSATAAVVAAPVRAASPVRSTATRIQRQRPARLAVGAAVGASERQADHVAADVMRAPSTTAVGSGVRTAISTRIQPRTPRSTPIVQREMVAGEGWKVGTLASWTGGGTLTYSQQQLDKKLLGLTDAHKALKTKLDSADSGLAELSGAKPPPNLAEAKQVYADWDITVGFKQADEALRAITGAIANMDGVSADVTTSYTEEKKGLTKRLGGGITSALLATRTPKEVEALAGRVTDQTLRTLGGGGLSTVNLTTLLTRINTDALMITLGPIGGAWLFENIDTYPLIELAANSTHAQVDDVTTRLTPEVLNKLTPALDAGTITSSLLDPLSAEVVEKLLKELTLAQIQGLITDLGAPRVKAMGVVKNNGKGRGPELNKRRTSLKAILAALKANADLLVALWTELSLANFDKIADAKPALEVAAMMSGIGAPSLLKLVPTMTQVELYDHAARLTKDGLKGFGEAMSGKDLLAVTTANPGRDVMLTALGTTHKAALAAATTVFADVATLNLVLDRCSAHLDVAQTAGFLADAAANRWKKADNLRAFFDKAGANIIARVNVAKLFAAENDGSHGAAAGAGSPAGAAAQATLGGRIYKAAIGDINHYMAGHSYSHFEMSIVNATRGPSTMWPTGTTRGTIIANAQTVLDDPAFLATFPGNAGYLPRDIAGFNAGVDRALGRITQLYPVGGTEYSKPVMEAVVHLFKSKG